MWCLPVISDFKWSRNPLSKVNPLWSLNSPAALKSSMQKSFHGLEMVKKSHLSASVCVFSTFGYKSLCSLQNLSKFNNSPHPREQQNSGACGGLTTIPPHPMESSSDKVGLAGQSQGVDQNGGDALQDVVVRPAYQNMYELSRSATKLWKAEVQQHFKIKEHQRTNKKTKS